MAQDHGDFFAIKNALKHPGFVPGFAKGIDLGFHLRKEAVKS
jgi:hypothetical protein